MVWHRCRTPAWSRTNEDCGTDRAQCPEVLSEWMSTLAQTPCPFCPRSSAEGSRRPERQRNRRPASRPPGRVVRFRVSAALRRRHAVLPRARRTTTVEITPYRYRPPYGEVDLERHHLVRAHRLFPHQIRCRGRENRTRSAGRLGSQGRHVDDTLTGEVESGSARAIPAPPANETGVVVRSLEEPPLTAPSLVGVSESGRRVRTTELQRRRRTGRHSAARPARGYRQRCTRRAPRIGTCDDDRESLSPRVAGRRRRDV